MSREPLETNEHVRYRNKSKACMIEDNGSTVCIDPSLPLLNLIGKKYTMMVLGVIGNNGAKKNFNEILSDIPNSSSTIISKRLKDLQDYNLIQRSEGVNGVTYSLTNFGQEVRQGLMPLLHLVDDKSLD